MSQVVCPLSNEKVNNNVARLVAALVIINTVAALSLNLWWLLFIQLYDFAVRAADKRQLSLFRYIGQHVANLLKLPVVAVDAAPKRFAAGVGLVFTLAIIAALLLNQFTAASVLAGILLLCAVLEALLAFCVGCYVYTFLVLPFTSSSDAGKPANQ